MGGGCVGLVGGGKAGTGGILKVIYAFSGQFHRFSGRFQRYSGFGRYLWGSLGEPLGGYLGRLLEGRKQGYGVGRGGILKAFLVVFSNFQLFSILKAENC